jgi:hypothetical protein
LSISAAFYLVSSVTALLYRRRLAVDQGIAPRKLNEDSVIGLA